MIKKIIFNTKYKKKKKLYKIKLKNTYEKYCLTVDCLYILGLANTFRMGLQIPLYQQPERHYERRATPPQPDRTSKVCLPSNPETKAKCPFLIEAFVNTKINVFQRLLLPRLLFFFFVL